MTTKGNILKRLSIALALILAVLLIALMPARVLAGDGEKLSLSEGICVNKAQALYGQGKVKDAVKTLEVFIKKYETNKNTKELHPYLYFLLGNFYQSYSQGSHDDATDNAGRHLQKAAQCYRAAVKSDPDFSEAWLNLAKCCYESQKYSDAAQSFEKAYQCTETKKSIHLYYAAVCRFQAREPEYALSLFETLLQTHPQDVTLAWKEVLVNILFTLERYRQALVYIKELVRESKPPKLKQWQEILLSQYLNLGMDTEALEFAQKLTRTDPLEPRWWKGLSHIHLKNEDQQKGLAALIIYGYLTPMTQAEIKLTADLYMAVDVPKKAARLYQEVLEQDLDPKILEKLTHALATAHDPDNAIKWIDKGLSLSSGKSKQDANLLLLKAQLLYIKRSWEQAAETYEKAAIHSAGTKHCGQAWLMLGYSAMNCRQMDQSLNAFKKAAKFKKQQRPAEKAIAQINSIRRAEKLHVLNGNGNQKERNKL